MADAVHAQGLEAVVQKLQEAFDTITGVTLDQMEAEYLARQLIEAYYAAIDKEKGDG